jgi:predicted adenine nucleotide alpha hydrolase (AANH) superfamily ATPase
MIKDLLIHTCCADCLLNLVYALEQDAQISKDTNLTLLFYNPNIHPRTEYMERLKALKQVIEQGKITQNVKLVIPEYRPKEYFESIALEQSRCLGCWKIRMKYPP